MTRALAVGALVTADLIREDSGFLAALLMGVFLANQRRIEIAPTLQFTKRWSSCRSACCSG